MYYYIKIRAAAVLFNELYIIEYIHIAQQHIDSTSIVLELLNCTGYKFSCSLISACSLISVYIHVLYFNCVN